MRLTGLWSTRERLNVGGKSDLVGAMAALCELAARRLKPEENNWTMADPLHPIIEDPWRYSIAEFHYHVGRDDTEPFIDLVLECGTSVRRLRFWSPQSLAIDEDGCFPYPTHGMVIFDVSKRQLDGLRVWVADLECTRGAIRFWARDVVDLDTMEAR